MLAATRRSARPTQKLSATQELAQELVTFRPELLARALKLTREVEAAEDLVQDTVERALRFQHHFQHGTNLRAWAHQILFTIFMTRCRRHRHERNAVNLLATAPRSWQLPSARMESLALSPPVARALESLPLQFRAAIVLIDLEEMSYKDAAVLLGAPVGTVMSRLHRGRSQLAEKIGGRREETLAA